METLRSKTKIVTIGNVKLGGNNPIAIQSMCNIKTSKVAKVVAQIHRLENAGCNLIRVSILDEKDAKALKKIKAQIHIPLIADIHFSPKLAMLAMKNGADKIRLNPGNIRNREDIDMIIEYAKAHNIAIRIGVNSGSTPKEVLSANSCEVSVKLMCDQLDNYISIFKEHNFDNLVLALKASNPLVTLECYRIAAQKYDYPLHIGVTETSVKDVGLIRSTVALAPLLMEGIGNTIRISLSDDPVEEVKAAKNLLHDVGLLPNHYTMISCPMCGRTTANTKEMASKIIEILENHHSNLTVACMGCVVNGVGEGMQADIGIACASKDKYMIFKKGNIIATCSKKEVLPLFEQHLIELENEKVEA